MRERWVFDASPEAVARQRQWCPECRPSKPVTLKRAQAAALERGGVCLSSECRSGASMLRWRCERGHEWTANAGLVLHGTWCPKCARAPSTGDAFFVQELKALAERRARRVLAANVCPHERGEHEPKNVES